MSKSQHRTLTRYSFAVRRPLVEARLQAIRQGEAGQILAEADDRERPRETWAVGVNWSKFSKEDLLEIVDVSVIFDSMHRIADASLA